MNSGGEVFLVRVPNWIGDTVMATAGLSGLDQLFPESRIVVVAKPWVIPVIEGHPAVDGILTHNPRRFPARAMDFFKTVRQIRRLKPSRGVLFHKNFESALLFFVSGIPERTGRPTDGRGFLLTRHVRLDDSELVGHQVHHYRSIVSAVAGRPCPPTRPRMVLSAAELDAADETIAALPDSGPVIPVAAGAAYGSAKCWPPERVAEFVMKAVNRLNARIVFIGGPGERDVSLKIRDSAGVAAWTMAGEASMRVQAAVIQRAGICVANDSGLMHVSAALPYVRTVAIFGPTKPAETAPYGEGHIVIHHPQSCWPCRHRHCPLNHECMRSISADEVLNAVETIVSCR